MRLSNFFFQQVSFIQEENNWGRAKPRVGYNCSEKSLALLHSILEQRNITNTETDKCYCTHSTFWFTSCVVKHKIPEIQAQPHWQCKANFQGLHCKDPSPSSQVANGFSGRRGPKERGRPRVTLPRSCFTKRMEGAISAPCSYINSSGQSFFQEI